MKMKDGYLLMQKTGGVWRWILELCASSFAQLNTKNIGAWVYFITEEKSEYK